MYRKIEVPRATKFMWKANSQTNIFQITIPSEDSDDLPEIRYTHNMNFKDLPESSYGEFRMALQLAIAKITASLDKTTEALESMLQGESFIP